MRRTRDGGQGMLQSWIVCMRKMGWHGEQDRGRFATTRDSEERLSPILAGQDDIEQSESSFTETHLDHINRDVDHSILAHHRRSRRVNLNTQESAVTTE
ncbi:hypothetical protein AZE42_09723 [Rhizopogon vesiculosus]|uniref:Uncharacterized protein n=1 Tax=Rhizopogon vesiculosus TaxID=180088 RepID=A0A1J8QVP9_9AGAM|nr:hypothetical protein AZE42_09723 [Rhizopogon vesiculosus]